MLVLASNSPRRKQILSLGGWTFTVQPAEIDERPLKDEAPEAYVLRLAKSKARQGAGRVPQEALVVAADTAVVDSTDHRSVILGKPADAGEAEEMLGRLRGRTHQVFTALAVLRVEDGKLLSDVCATHVTMRNYTDDEIQNYILSGDPFDKAGAYAIQHPGFKPVDSLEGCYTNVMGLPLCRLARMLAKLGLPPDPALPFACLHSSQAACSFTPSFSFGE